MNRFGPLRFALAALFIALTGVLLRGRVETIPSRPPLSLFPAQLSSWTGKDIPLDPDSLRVLGPGDFLLRSYHDVNPQSTAPSVDFFIAYFPTQRTGDTIHSPKHCLPGNGWVPEQSSRIQVSLPEHAPFPANRYVIARGTDRELVLYWYWAHDRGVASEYWAKFYLVKDALEMNRSDGALVRITADMLPGETAAEAQQRLRPFTMEVVPQLNTYIPR
jgi:EpsI family protein